MSTKPEDELARLRLRIASLEEDSQMFLNEHDENVRLHFENVDLKEQNARMREALEYVIEMTDYIGTRDTIQKKARAALEGK